MDATTTSNLELHTTINSRLSLEENNVSRQVGKPIYMATQVNDGQTQCTEQTLEFSTAVKLSIRQVHISKTF